MTAVPAPAEAALRRILPVPRSVTRGEGTFVLRPGTPVVVATEDLLGPAALFVERLAAETGLELGRPRTGTAGPGAVLLTVDAAHPGVTAVPVARGLSALGDDLGAERHTLTVGPEGVRVTGASPTGVHRGLGTLVALAEQLPATAAGVELPAIDAADGPALAWRGLSLDVVRTAFSAAEVRRVIDLLDRYKLNVLHLHLTDDQAWRLEITARPELTRDMDPEDYFTQARYRELVAYAAARFITVVPEIDMPGHSTAAITACPELTSQDTASLPRSAEERLARFLAGDFRPMWLEPGRPEVWSFVDDVLAEVAALTPGRFVHIGGDEAFGMPAGDHQDFVARVRERVRAHGKEPIGWQETVRAPGAPGEVVQLWIDPELAPDPAHPVLSMLPPQVVGLILESERESAADALRMGEQRATVVLSARGRAYLDRRYAEAVDGAAEERRLRLGHPVYPPHTVRDACTAPITGIDDDPGFAVAGFEAAVWCESVDDADDLSFLLLPRLPGLAERAWTAGPARDWEDLRARLAAQAPAWRRHGHTWFPAPSVDWA
ncbi:family 20 glycosylhydrolase [Kitasatospora putterlickiae]|uniref:beta-N-acetylhexosaminidase n=1 Tax=Kitasatospora putterlickiae TaxID=221725 RepID=A0ABN1XYI5_9ACTN